MTQEASIEKPTAGPGKDRAIWGFVLLAPALLCCLTELLIPTLQTFSLSLQNVRLPGEAGEFVGLENYGRLLQDERFAGALGYTLLLMGARLLVVAIFPPLLALVINQFGRGARLPMRLLYTFPLVFFPSVVVALIWAMILNPTSGLWAGTVLVDAQQVRPTLLFIDSLYTLGLAAGVGLIVYLAALRVDKETPASKQALIPAVSAWLIGLCATAALSLQSFSLIYTLTGGGPAGRTITLGIYQYMVTFQQLRFGLGAAIAGLNLIAAMLLGIITGLIVVWAGLRLKIVPWDRARILWGSMKKPLAVACLILVVLASLGVGIFSAMPLLAGALNSLKGSADLTTSSALLPAKPTLDAYSQLRESTPLLRILMNTIVPVTGAVLLIQLPLAYLGALGIGAFRPLGRRSEWLLLLFSPWLFISLIPLSMTLSIPVLNSMRDAGTLNTLMGLAPPVLMSVPLLFILTLFFKGQSARWDAAQAEGQAAGRAFFRHLILPSLPLAILLAGAIILMGLQDLWWPLIAASTPNRMTLMTTLLRLHYEFGPQAIPVLGAAITLLWLPLAACLFVFFAIFQTFYLDRLSLSK